MATIGGTVNWQPAGRSRGVVTPEGFVQDRSVNPAASPTAARPTPLVTADQGNDAFARQSNTIGPITAGQSSDSAFTSWYQAYTNGQTTLPFNQWKLQPQAQTASGVTAAPGTNPYVSAPPGAFQQTEMPGFANPITVPTLQTLVNNDVYAVTGIRPPGFNELMAQVTGQKPEAYDPRQGILGDAQLYTGLYPNTPEAQNPDLMQQVLSQLYTGDSLYQHPASAQPMAAPQGTAFGSVSPQAGTSPNTGVAPPQTQQTDPLAFLGGTTGTPPTVTPTTPTPAAPTPAAPTTPDSWNQFLTWLQQIQSPQVQKTPLGYTQWGQSPELAALIAALGKSNQAQYNPLWFMNQALQ